MKKRTKTHIAWDITTYLLDVFVKFSVLKSGQVHSFTSKRILMLMQSDHRSFIISTPHVANSMHYSYHGCVGGGVFMFNKNAYKNEAGNSVIYCIN